MTHAQKSHKIFDQALEYIRQSAESECVDALTELGRVYELGGIRSEKTGKIYGGAKKNFDKAKELYQEAADKDCVLAQNYLGSFYWNHEKNFFKAFKYFKLASASGKCASALSNLGYCFEVGSD